MVLEFLVVDKRIKERVDAGDDREVPLLDEFHQARNVARIGHHHLGGGKLREAQRRGETEDVIERQSGHGHFFAHFKGLTDPGAGLLDVGKHVAVREHGAFGHACGAAGVLQQRNIGVFEFERLKALGMTDRKRLAEIDVTGKVEFRHHLLDVTHDKIGGGAFEPGQHVANLGGHDVFDGRFRERVLQRLGEVFDDDDGLGTAVGKLVPEFVRGVERIDVDGNHARAQDAQQRDDVLLQVGHHDGDAIARFHAGKRLQVARKVLREIADFPVCEHFVHADEGGVIAVGFGNRVEKCRNGGETIGVDFGRKAFGIVLEPGKRSLGHG